MRVMLARAVAVSGAIVGWAALGLQLYLSLQLVSSQGGTLGDALWRFLGYFTVLSNGFAAIALTLAVFGRAGPRLIFCATTAMILVGVTYSLLLRATWNPQGLQKLADVALHDAAPVLIVLLWLLRPHRVLGGRDVAISLIWPLGYCAYAMTRGTFDNWYAYHFIDVGLLGIGAVAINCVAISAIFFLMSAALVWLDRKMA